jgi:hypothetical protein
MGDVQDTDGSKTVSDANVELGLVDYVVVAFPAGQAHFSYLLSQVFSGLNVSAETARSPRST